MHIGHVRYERDSTRHFERKVKILSNGVQKLWNFNHNLSTPCVESTHKIKLILKFRYWTRLILILDQSGMLELMLNFSRKKNSLRVQINSGRAKTLQGVLGGVDRKSSEHQFLRQINSSWILAESNTSNHLKSARTQNLKKQRREVNRNKINTARTQI